MFLTTYKSLVGRHLDKSCIVYDPVVNQIFLNKTQALPYNPVISVKNKIKETLKHKKICLKLLTGLKFGLNQLEEQIFQYCIDSHFIYSLEARQ